MYFCVEKRSNTAESETAIMNTPKKRDVTVIKENYDAIKAVESGIIIIVNIIITLFSIQCISCLQNSLCIISTICFKPDIFNKHGTCIPSPSPRLTGFPLILT